MPTITLVEVAKSIKLSPKIARARVRRYEGAPKPIKGTKYEYPASAKSKLVAFLRA